MLVLLCSSSSSSSNGRPGGLRNMASKTCSRCAELTRCAGCSPSCSASSSNGSPGCGRPWMASISLSRCSSLSSSGDGADRGLSNGRPDGGRSTVSISSACCSGVNGGGGFWSSAGELGRPIRARIDGCCNSGLCCCRCTFSLDKSFVCECRLIILNIYNLFNNYYYFNNGSGTW